MRGTKWLVVIAVVAIAALFAQPVFAPRCNGGDGAVIIDIDAGDICVDFDDNPDYIAPVSGNPPPADTTDVLLEDIEIFWPEPDISCAPFDPRKLKVGWDNFGNAEMLTCKLPNPVQFSPGSTTATVVQDIVTEYNSAGGAPPNCPSGFTDIHLTDANGIRSCVKYVTLNYDPGSVGETIVTDYKILNGNVGCGAGWIKIIWNGQRDLTYCKKVGNFNLGLKNYCSDNAVQNPNDNDVAEECDDGNLVSGDGCSNACVLEQTCDNGVIEGTEVCDGALLGGETCSTQGAGEGGTLSCAADCLSFDTSACTACADGFSETVFHDQSNDYSACQSSWGTERCCPTNQCSGRTNQCFDVGDTHTDPPGSPVYFTDDRMLCTNDWTCGENGYNFPKWVTCNSNRVGDVVEGKECCAAASPWPFKWQDHDCQYCGDGVVQTPNDDSQMEVCDDGNTVNGDGCDSSCQSEYVCGDGVTEGPEQCDDVTNTDSYYTENPTNNDGTCVIDDLRPASSCKTNVCGDGYRRSATEQCDNGPANADIPDSCRDGSTPDATACDLPACGDGIQDTGEACDDGSSNSDTADACRDGSTPDATACELPMCGDGIQDTGEQCDDGSANADAPDACRDGTGPLTTACENPRCGDGILDSSEQCDDGNLNDLDGCSSVCTIGNCVPGFTDTRYHSSNGTLGPSGQNWDGSGMLSRNRVASYAVCCDANLQCVINNGACRDIGDYAATGSRWVCEQAGAVPDYGPGPTLARCTTSQDGSFLGVTADYCCSEHSADPGASVPEGDHGFGADSEAWKQEDAGVADHCLDGSDNNCDTEADYDGFSSGTVWLGVNAGAGNADDPLWPKGDSACGIGITAADATPEVLDTLDECFGEVRLDCTVSQQDVRSVVADIDGVPCAVNNSHGSWGWSGNTVRFSCPVPATNGVSTARCSINQSRSYVSGAAQMTDDITASCFQRVEGNVNDTKTKMGIDGASVTAWRGTVYSETNTSQPDGSYVLRVLAGINNFTASHPSYYDTDLRTDISVYSDLTDFDFFLSPEECSPSCSMFGQCNLQCDGQNGCSLDPAWVQYQVICAGLCSLATYDDFVDAVTEACQFVDPGKTFEFVDGLMITCCGGSPTDILPGEGVVEAPLSVESCAEDLVPHTRLVEHNGQVHKLVTVTYRSCDGN